MKSMKLKNSLTWHCYVNWILVGLFLAAVVFHPYDDFSWKYFLMFIIVWPLCCAIMCCHLRNTYEIKDGNLHIHEDEYWFVHNDYTIPIRNIDKADLVWRMKLPCHSLRLWVGSAKFTLNADVNVSEILLKEINRIKGEEQA